MPIFEFKCLSCGKIETVIQKFTDAPPNCEGEKFPHPPEAMDRRISIPARAQFKGSGFYETDYKKGH